MKVTLLNYTGKGMGAMYAAALLAYTKNTRLNMTAGGLDEFINMRQEELVRELEYMSNTIPSSWEFVDYIFVIEGVTRAYTHQAVRTRSGSYAQQTMRVLNVEGFEYSTGPSIENDTSLKRAYDNEMFRINETYRWLIKNGAEIQDARGVLPTNINTNIVAKFNLRTVAELAQKRSSPRTQGEYREVLDGMINAVLEVHPWAHLFLRNRKIEAAAKLDEFIKEMANDRGYKEMPQYAVDLLKAVDILRG